MTGNTNAKLEPCKRDSLNPSAASAGNRGELAALVGFMAIWCGFWLWLSAGPASSRPSVEYTFNSMLVHLMHGQFDVDPNTVGNEGYLRNGRVYAYWGIWCAFVRLPLLIIGRMDVDMTPWSSLLAVCIAGYAKLRTVFLLREYGPRNRNTKLAVDFMVVYILMGGSQIAYLRSVIFQEVMFWAVAFAAIFVYLAVKGLVRQNFDLSTLASMALCAGLAVLTRVSTGIGLILAFGLLLLALAAQTATAAADSGSAIQNWKRSIFNRRILVPIGILGALIVATAAVNYFRWGNPATFVDNRLYIGNKLWPERNAREAMYGLFSFQRLPFGLIYYFVPIWILPTSPGHYLLEQTQTRLFDVIELPPGSFFLTDLAPICLIALVIYFLLRNRTISLLSRCQIASIAAGLLAPCVLMLTAVSMTYRYRMEFYPELDFLAFLALYVIITSEAAQEQFARFRFWLIGALGISIMASFASVMLYMRSHFGPALDLMRHGISAL